MRFSRDRRGQSVVIGTVILFGFLILALSLYQVQVVPQENSDIEFDHSQQVEGEFLDLRNAVLSASRTGAGRSTSLKLGTRYPQRTFALNPPPASGQLSTTGPRELRIENATIEGDENVVAYWENRTQMDGAIAFDTRSLRYSPGYNEFRNGPDLVYEHSLVVAEFDSAALGRSGQTVVDSDNRIRLTALDGDVDESGTERTSLDPDTLSQSRRSVTLNSTGSDPIVLELPTDVSIERDGDLESQWHDRLGTDADAKVEDVTVADGTIRIELNASETYRLSLGKVGLGTEATAPNEADGYLTKISTENQAAAAEVRDQFNNPVVGAEVAVVVNGTRERTLRSDSDGRVVFKPENVQPEVNLTINDAEAKWETVTYEPGTVGGDGSGDASGINPGGNSDIVLNDIGVGGSGQRTVDLQFRNNADQDRELQEMEFTLYYDPQGDTLDSFTIRGPDDTGQELTLRDGFVELDAPFTIPAGETATFTIEFDANAQNDLLGVSFRDDLNRQALYLAGIEGTIDEADGGGGGSNGGNGPTQASGIVSNDDASTFSGTSGVQFSVRNDGSDLTELDSISIDSTTSQAEVLKEQNGGTGAGQREIHVASSSSSGFHEAGDAGQDRYSLGTQVILSSNVGIATDDDATITLSFFQTDGPGGSGNRVDMTGEDIEVTLYFVDGSQKSLVISVPN